MSLEYILYCDESVESGRHYSNFYGGLLVRSTDVEDVRARIAQKKAELNLHGELKWQKVTASYLDKYVAVVDLLFDLVAADRIKLRIMFRQNLHKPVGLTFEQREDGFFRLYYQFIKHAFGLGYAGERNRSTRLRILFDDLPDSKEKCAQFKAYIAALNHAPEFKRANISVDPEQIAEVDSHDHDLLQCVDIVLGAMQFRLNDQHLAIPPGKSRRGSRTVAKEKLYKHVNRRIRSIYPGFNIGVSTGTRGDLANRWNDPYRHWVFVPSNWERDQDAGKKKPRARYVE